MGNVDFADVRAIMENAGSFLMGLGIATGKLSGSIFADFFLFTKCFIDLKKGAKEVQEKNEDRANTG